jgi:RHS repeat-associated protein
LRVYAQNKYRYTNKELQNQEFSDGTGLEEYDFGARFQDPQLGRMNQEDPHGADYFRLSPYNYSNNNPILYNDPTGKDYAIYFKKNKNGNMEITITATYYVKKGDKESKESAEAGTKLWNDQSGQFVLRVGDKNEHTDYEINFDLKVVDVDDPQKEKNKDYHDDDGALTKDGSSNIYQVVDDNAISTPGLTTGLYDAKVRRSKSDDPQAGAHEIGHTLGIDDQGSGVMNGGNTGETTIYNSNVQDIIKFALKNQNPVSNKVSIHGDIPTSGKVKSNPNKTDSQ